MLEIAKFVLISLSWYGTENVSCKTILIVDVKKYPPDAESLARAIIVG